jgi:hypothetical protein
VTPLHETHCQKRVTDQACDQFPVLARLIEIEPIDRIRIVEYEPGNLERHPVFAVVPLRFPIVPFELVVAHDILVCRITSKSQIPHSRQIATDPGTRSVQLDEQASGQPDATLGRRLR